MRALGLPLRITPDGQFDRVDAADGLVRLIQAMAGTTAGSWPHAPWFGLHELFLEANMEREDQQRLADAINAALAHLGVTWATVHQVRSSWRNAALGERGFDLTILLDDGRPVYAGVNA